MMPRTMSEESARAAQRVKRTVDVAKARSLALLGVVKASSPVDGDLALLAVQTGGSLHAAASADGAELEEAVKDRAIIADIVLVLLSGVGLHVVRRDLLQELDVLVRVELRHFELGGRLRALPGSVRGDKTLTGLRRFPCSCSSRNS
jgi:hypothetical protein